MNVRSYVKEEEAIRAIRALVALASYDGIPEQETRTAEWIRDFFLQEGIEARLFPVRDGRCNVIARLPGNGGGRSLLLTGHTDTVPPYDFEKALQPEVREGRIYGRGTNDMKGQLVTMMFAMASLKRAGNPLKGDLIFAGVIDEELNSLGTKAMLQSGISADGAIVGEGTSFAINTGQKGLEWFEVRFLGKAAHGAAYREGINAVNMAARFIEKVNKELAPKIFARTHPICGEATVNMATIQGGTQPSTVPGECTVSFDRRYLPGEKYDEVVGEFENLLSGLAAEDPTFRFEFVAKDRDVWADGYVHPPMEIASDHPLVQAAKRAVESETGAAPRLSACGAWTDAGLLYEAGIPTIIFGPGDLLFAHTRNEHIAVSELLPAIQIYSDIAREFCI